jgi:hypothetical protein
MTRRCLWNSFIVVGRLSTLVGLFVLATPELYLSFSKIKLSLGTMFEEETVRRLYEDLRTSDFSREVLQSVPPNLSVLPVGNVGWSDLGEPHRVANANRLRANKRHTTARQSERHRSNTGDQTMPPRVNLNSWEKQQSRGV